jgi:hypothetical protein
MPTGYFLTLGPDPSAVTLLRDEHPCSAKAERDWAHISNFLNPLIQAIRGFLIFRGMVEGMQLKFTSSIFVLVNDSSYLLIAIICP